MRDKYNISKDSIAKAALFIYLNKTCFNGIWRVNNDGRFNVPCGHKNNPCLPTKDWLIKLSESLSNAKLIHCDYKKIIKNVKEKDFVYFDPPYPPLNGTSYFTHYTKERFTKDNHLELAKFAQKLDNMGCKILITNADTPYIRSLYRKNFHIIGLKVTRWIRADGKRYKAKEIAITNYDI